MYLNRAQCVAQVYRVEWLLKEAAQSVGRSCHQFLSPPSKVPSKQRFSKQSSIQAKTFYTFHFNFFFTLQVHIVHRSRFLAVVGRITGSCWSDFLVFCHIFSFFLVFSRLEPSVGCDQSAALPKFSKLVRFSSVLFDFLKWWIR